MAVDLGIEKELEGLCAQAALRLDPAEEDEIAHQLNDLLKVLGKIKEVDTTGVEPAFHQTAPPVCFREDEVEPSLPLDLVFANTANQSENYFRVPRITGGEADEV